MKSILRSFRHGQRGFTLIELLVVVAILGILAAIIVPNIAGFIGKGKAESANTEAHNVETAVVAHMVAENFITWSGDVGPADYDSPAPEDYLTNPGTLQATYTFANANIESAELIENSKWTGLTYDPDKGWIEATTPP